MDESGGLKSVAGAFTVHLAPGEPAQLCIDERRELLQRLAITVAPRFRSVVISAASDAMALLGPCFWAFYAGW